MRYMHGTQNMAHYTKRHELERNNYIWFQEECNYKVYKKLRDLA